MQAISLQFTQAAGAEELGPDFVIGGGALGHSSGLGPSSSFTEVYCDEVTSW